jgi:hypothetical protein
VDARAVGLGHDPVLAAQRVAEGEQLLGVLGPPAPERRGGLLVDGDRTRAPGLGRFSHVHAILVERPHRADEHLAANEDPGAVDVAPLQPAELPTA